MLTDASTIIRTNNRGQTAEEILQESIQVGIERASNIVSQVRRTIPTDQIVRSPKLRFEVGQVDEANESDHLEIHMRAKGLDVKLHRNAVSQICTYTGLPIKYADKLVAPGEHRGRRMEMLTGHLNQWMEMHQGEKRLVRSLDGEARAFLSDKYKRIDSIAVVDTFSTAMKDIGARPYADRASGLGAYATDLRWSISGVLPQVFRTTRDAVAVGVQLRNSDYGRGRLELSLYLIRLWCLNGCTANDVMKKTHVGSRLDENIEYSAKTYELDTAASTSALKDAIADVMGERKVKALVDGISKLEAQQVDWAKAKVALRKKLLKGEMEAVEAAFEGDDVVNLPAGSPPWRVSNALSWVAKSDDVSPERKLDLERYAGEALDVAGWLKAS